MALKRQLGLFDVFCITAGTMISSGLFVLPGILYTMTGPSLIFSYALAAVMITPTMFSKAELGSAMPKSGASYFFIERSLGSLPGTMAGFASWISLILKSSFALIGFGGLATLIIPQANEWMIKAIAITTCVILTIINACSVKKTGKLQIALVFILLFIILLFSLSSLPYIKTVHYSPLIPHGMRSFLAATGTVFISFGGLTKVVDVSEEIRQVHKNVPRGMFSAFFIVVLLYLVATFVTVGILDPSMISGSLAPLSLAAKEVFGLPGGILVTIGALLAFITTANAGILAASRSPMAMSRDGLLPQFFAKVGRRCKTPIISILVTSTAMILIIALISIQHLVETAATMMIIMFMTVNFSVIIMRESGFQSYRPHFKSPCYPWLQIAAIASYGFLIIDMGLMPLSITMGFALLALLWYFGYVQHHVNRKSAFMSLVGKLFATDIQRNDLEQELRELSLESGVIALDHFDRSIRRCPIISVEKSLSRTDLFQIVAKTLSKETNVSEKILFSQLQNKEKEMTSIVAEGIAVPFIPISDHSLFEIVLFRLKKGVLFSPRHSPVKALFVIAGSEDKKSHHLEALMAITHIIKESDFSKRWNEAYNVEQLRDIILLSHRKRKRE